MSVALLGTAYFINMHGLWYFIVVQIFGGIMQVSTMLNEIAYNICASVCVDLRVCDTLVTLYRVLGGLAQWLLCHTGLENTSELFVSTILLKEFGKIFTVAIETCTIV